MSVYSRSLNGDLHEGMTDGRFRKTAPNRGGLVEASYLANRDGLNPDMNYDYITQEMPSKTLPDGSAQISV